ncbi:major facilitator superfamily domain-containing protein 6-like [Canis lupus baileyi]|uniref:Major facilitator superfamily domain containing 6 like n=2 Tax=Canis lupus TaxID=9612 RepID=A0A8C0N9Q1_CANLF|nr:major facilitator superfamily domain-containing protein 6-like [Canis lupus familiaris]XP_048966161.1 major facilitator superfamily domain-containing protein 6-like [Canis lupus dingo]XP_546614.2 major facilitator superfamily domain-containing protein 6-like [Canis lupus familiaris]|eukprot:XP_546614.2 major facilitator superfamily domain-containing protein 6-like [Canis lupus familiaris]
MSANPQWDISRALGVARLFHLVCGVRDACVTPFLTLYLRQLGLAAPWVGVLMGAKHLVAAFWAPSWAFLAKSYRKRRALLTGSLLGSAGASLLMALVPPPDEAPADPSCNASRGARPSALPPAAASIPRAVGAPGLRRAPAGGVHAPAGRPAGYTVGYAVGSVEGAGTAARVLPPVASGLRDTARAGAFKVGRTAPPLLAGGTAPGSPANLSAAKGDAGALGLSLEGLRWTFLLSLGSVVFWELLTAPLEQVADDSLYEYLDFVDATDRYGSLWIWRLLGLSAGVCGIAAAVGQLECFVATSGPRGVLHFYGYSVVSTVALLVSIAFPVPICRRQEPSYKTIKALSLVGGDPRLILLTFTVFLVGAATSAVQNFLFWHMKDHGSSELVMGFSVALGLLGEILLHPFKTTLLRKLSRMGTVGLGLGCLAAQLLYYSFLWSWWAALPAQILSAVSNGALWWAVKASVEDLATPRTERPLGAMFRGHIFGGGSSLGSFVGGFVVMYFSLAVLYRACCVLLLLWLALLLSIQSRLPQEQKINYSKLLVMEASDTSDSEQGTERDWLVKAMREEYSE